ncbi:right-handed parallel beta-helix repeat-containing protein [Kitasatospora sp. NPDC001261]|uniref:right-handed parallel beta-helix repeat-containing protein n=1 Tax=Kitasatospora sp. NPDC001261 TaxID=3364012 RepID=UPI0036C05F16
MSRIRTALVVGATLLGTVGLPAVSAGGAAAAGTTLHVHRTTGCTNSGTGTESAPYCTIAPALAAVQPGQTVEIGEGTYPEDLTFTRSGTAGAPITVRGVTGPGGSGPMIGDQKTPVNGFVVRGADHLRFENLYLTAAPKSTLLVDGARDVSFDQVTIAEGATLHVTNGSADVRFARGRIGSYQDPAVTVDGGSTGTVVTTNQVYKPGSGPGTVPGIVVKDAPNTVVVANTVNAPCSRSIVLDGGSAGAVVENNVVNSANGPRACGARSADAIGITVGPDATAGSKVDYNVVDPRSGGPAYSWAGGPYTSQEAFTAATGQGEHDIVAPSLVDRGPDAPADPKVDSADENAPGMLPTDSEGRAPVDDPTVPNTGTGSGTRDRGATERSFVGSAFTPAGPTRLLDTRAPIGVPSAAAVPAWGTVDLPVAGLAGVPAEGVTAVTMNVTVTEPGVDGHLRVYPHGSRPWDTSALNWTAGRTVANLVTVPVKDGTVSFYNSSGGTVHLIADLAGYYSPKGSLFHPQGPTRLLDTRAPIGVPSAAAVPAWGTVDLPVAGLAGVPAEGVTAVTMNVTVTEPQADGHLTVHPHGDQRPNASNLNWTAGRTTPNLVTVPVKDGRVSFYNASGGTVHLIADLAGYHTAEGRISYHPDGPERLLDTRVQPGGSAPVPAWGTLTLDLVNYPYLAGMTLNVTAVEPGAEGHLTVYPQGDTVPNASNLNFLPGETVANQVVVPVSKGKVSFHNASGAPLHLVVDRFGYQAY